jgi:hypothetical protein
LQGFLQVARRDLPLSAARAGFSGADGRRGGKPSAARVKFVSSFIIFPS